MPAPDADLQENLITLFRHAAQAMVRELVLRVRAAGYDDIRPAHSRVFETLAPSGSRISDMAERAAISHQSMSELVAHLEAQGYVARRPDPADRRAKVVYLTPRGRALMRLASAEIANIEAAWIRRLGQAGLEGDLPAALTLALAAAEASETVVEDDF